MFWSFILPFKVTAVLMALLPILAVVLAPRFKWKRAPALGLGISAAVVLFLPTLIAVDAVMAPFRFRIHHYDAYDELTYWRAKHYIPAAATDLTVLYKSNGYDAKFKISELELRAWYKTALAADEGGAQGYRNLLPIRVVSDEDHARWAEDFTDLGWEQPQKALLFEGPYEGDWGGSTILYDPDREIAYQTNAIW